MIHGQMLRIALIVVALLNAAPAMAFADFTNDFVRIPEPGTLTLLASGAAALGGIGWLRRRNKK